MKRILVAVSFALFAAPLLATPFEQTQFDRGMTGAAPADSASAGSSGASGSSSVWTQDHNFVAPAP